MLHIPDGGDSKLMVCTFMQLSTVIFATYMQSTMPFKKCSYHGNSTPWDGYVVCEMGVGCVKWCVVCGMGMVCEMGCVVLEMGVWCMRWLWGV